MFCRTCGKEVLPTDRFCFACGASNTPRAADEPEPAPASAPAPPPSPAPFARPQAEQSYRPASARAAPHAFNDRKFLAGFWVRFAAVFLDGLFLWIPSTIASVILALVVRPSDEVAGFLYYGVSVVVAWLYCAVMESSSWQATLGKRALGVKVVDAQGERVSFLRATGRHLAKFFSYLTLGIGYLMVAWTERAQGLHDKMAGTLVVARATPPEAVSDSSPAERMSGGGVGIAIAIVAGLFILIAILGILAAVAIPAYQDYLKRSKVTEAAAVLGACKTSVAEFLDAKRRLPASIEEAGCHPTSTPYVETAVVRGGLIGAKLRNIDAALDGHWLALQATSQGRPVESGLEGIDGWSCSTDAPAKLFKYLPANCRQSFAQ